MWIVFVIELKLLLSALYRYLLTPDPARRSGISVPPYTKNVLAPPLFLSKLIIYLWATSYLQGGRIQDSLDSEQAGQVLLPVSHHQAVATHIKKIIFKR